MSTNDTVDQVELGERMKAQREIAETHGEAWVKRLEPELSRLPKGTFVVINCRTGEYIVSEDLLKAAEEFNRRFKEDVGYAQQIGGGFFVGGGLG
jgi:hypothetical protein